METPEMRKDRKQQKNENVVQLELFSYTGKPIDGGIDSIGSHCQSGVELSSQLKEYRIQTEHLLDDVVQKSWNAIMYTASWWKLSNKVVAKQTMNIRWFTLLGLKSLSERMSLY